MQNQNLKLKLFFFGLCFLVFGLCGCAVVEYFKPEKPPYDELLSQSYYVTQLKSSTAADVLAVINMPEYELLSQSRSVIASSGQKKKGHEIWFNMVAFDENTLTAKRKYFFLVDERPKSLWVQPKRKLSFDSEMVLGAELFNEPYANDNAKRTAMLRKVLVNVRGDMAEVDQEHRNLKTCGMLINQTIETILVKLDASPVLATKLNPAEGLDFDHITLGPGTIWMGIVGDIVNVRIRIDSYVRTHDDPFALED
ncbi:MAG: hypothetical protein ACYTDW_11185 [Planctomycetota bacterium]|jgi:hypothetical protein